MKIQRIINNIFIVLIIALAIFSAIFPVYWIVSTAFKIEGQAVAIPPVIFFKPTLQSFKAVLAKGFYPALINSLIIGISVLLISLVFGSLAAYSLARYKVGGKALVLAVLVTQMIPPMVITFPLFIMMQNLKLIDTKTGIILAELFSSLPFVVWMMRQFILQIPVEVEEAARIDGASNFRTFIEIVIPMVRPGLVSAGIFTFLNSWNEYLFPLILSISKAKTVTIMTTSFMTTFDILKTQINAASTLVMIPPIIFVLIFRKYIVSGIVGESVKG